MKKRNLNQLIHACNIAPLSWEDQREVFDAVMKRIEEIQIMHVQQLKNLRKKIIALVREAEEC